MNIKFTLLILLLSVILSAKDITGLDIDNLKKMSYIQLQMKYTSNMEDENLNLYLGLKELEQKEYDRAIASFERVLIYNENSIDAKIAMADAYSKQGSYSYAKSILSNLKKDNVSSELLLKKITNILQYIDDKREKHFLNSIFILGTQYSNNVLSTKDANKSDYSYQTAILLNHKYLLNNSWTIKNSIMAFQKDYIDTNNRKTKLISYTPTLSKLSENYILDLSLYFDDIYFGSEYNVISYGIAPKMKYRHSQSFDYFVNMRYLVKKDQLSTKLDSTLSDILMGVKINKIPNIIGNVKLSASYANESSDMDTLEKSSLKTNIIYGFKINKNMSALLDYSNKITDYIQREDTLNSFTITNTINFSKIMTIQVKVNHKTNDSDDAEFQYETTTYGLTLIKRF